VAHFPWLDPHASAITQVAALGLAAYCVLSAVRGRRRYGALVAAREADDGEFVRRHYRRAMIRQAVVTAAVLVLVAADPGLRGADVGLRLPHGGQVGRAVGWAVYLLVVLVAVGCVLRVRALRGRSVPGQRHFAALVARAGERRAAAGLSLGAGVSEELLFRGLFTAIAVQALSLHPLAAVGLLSVLFGAGHLYQGWKGMLGVALIGWAFGVIYVETGSLLVPVIVHVAVDLRALVLVPIEQVSARRAGPGVGPLSERRGRPAARRRRAPGPAGRGRPGTRP